MPSFVPFDGFPYDFPIVFGTPNHAVVIEDPPPIFGIDYYYVIPYSFFQEEPREFRAPYYYEAWQNQSTTLMPIYTSEEINGPIHTFPYLTQVISRPVIMPDGTGVTSPTKAEPVHTGRNDLTLAPL